MGYLGNDLKVAYSTYKNIDDISGSFNGSTTSFSLLVGGVAPSPLPLNSQQCLISVGGVVQRPDDTGAEGFRLSGGNIVFSSAPGTGEDFFGVILAGADYVNVGANFPSGSAAVPSITFDSDLDTGIYNSAANQVSITTAGTERLRIDSAGQIESVSLGSASAPAFSFTTDPNTGIYSPGADQVAISTNGTARVTVNSSGNVGIGTTSASGALHCALATSASPSTGWTNGTAVFGAGGSTGSAFGIAHDTTNGTRLYSIEPGVAWRPIEMLCNGLIFKSTNNSEAARFDTSGRLLVGTSTSASTTANVVVQGSSNGQLELRCATDPSSSGTALGVLRFTNNSGGLFAQIYSESDGTVSSSSDLPGRLVFSTTKDGASSPTERIRIQNDGTERHFADFDVINARTAVGAGTTYALFWGTQGATSNTSAGTNTIFIYTNGNIQNTNGSYTTLSDAKLKENIVDAGSQWDDLKAIQIRNWNFKVETGHETHRQIGPIAQELETVCPGLVFETPDRDEDGNDLGTTTKGVNQSVLYMKAVKALQEAMERIEQLEAEMAAVKAQLA